MKLSTIRIGNLVLTSTNKTAVIDEILDGIEGVVRVIIPEHDDETQFGFGCGQINGIQVTEYWMEAFDFQFVQKAEWVESDYIHELLNPELKIRFAWYEQLQLCYEDDILCNFQYIHELQNIFFDLTGKELALKIKQ